MIPLFMHIPKASGSALSDWMYATFRSDAPRADEFLVEGGIYYYPSGYVDSMPVQSHARIRCNLSNRNLRAVLGHFMYGIHKYIAKPSAYVTVLREPVDRLVSLYYFHKLVQDKDGSFDGIILSPSMSLADFARTPLYPEADNGQVRRLAGFTGKIGSCTQDHLELAKKRLANFAAVGVSNQLHKVVERTSSVFRIQNDTPLFAKNTNPQKKATSIPANEVEQIVAANWLDVELYKYALRELVTGPAI